MNLQRNDLTLFYNERRRHREISIGILSVLKFKYLPMLLRIQLQKKYAKQRHNMINGYEVDQASKRTGGVVVDD